MSSLFSVLHSSSCLSALVPLDAPCFPDLFCFTPFLCQALPSLLISFSSFSPSSSPFWDGLLLPFFYSLSLSRCPFLLHSISKLHSLFLRKSARPRMELLSWQPKGASGFHWGWCCWRGQLCEARGQAKGRAMGVTWGAVEIGGGRGRCWAQRRRDWREKQEREEGGEKLWAAAALWVSLHSLLPPASPGKWVTEGRSSTQTDTGKGATSPE